MFSFLKKISSVFACLLVYSGSYSQERTITVNLVLDDSFREKVRFDKVTHGLENVKGVPTHSGFQIIYDESAPLIFVQADYSVVDQNGSSLGSCSIMVEITQPQPFSEEQTLIEVSGQSRSSTDFFCQPRSSEPSVEIVPFLFSTIQGYPIARLAVAALGGGLSY